MSPSTERRAVIIGNRMPINGTRNEALGSEQDYEIKVGDGGIAAAFATSKLPRDQRPLFIATENWLPGIEASNKLRFNELRDLDAKGLIDLPFVPYGVPANRRENNAFYESVANTCNWLLMHFMNEGLSMFSQAIKPLDRSELARTEEFTRKYVDTVIRTIEGSDVNDARVWYQDYHFMLAPRIHREKVPDATIGYFHHIPFPPPYANTSKTEGVFTRIDAKHAAMYVEGMLGADQVGFHTAEYAENFFKWIEELGPNLSKAGSVNRQDMTVTFGERVIQVTVNPISVNAEYIRGLCRDPEVIAEARAIRERYGDKLLLFGADRLDPTKATPERIDGFHRALQLGAERGLLRPETTVFSQFSGRSREQLRVYAQHIEDTQNTVQAVRDDLGPNASALNFHLHGLEFRKLVPYALAADMLLATPAVDGLNLMVKEYALIASMAREVLDRQMPGIPITGRGAGAWVEVGANAKKLPGYPDVELGQVIGVAGSRRGSVANGILAAAEMRSTEAGRKKLNAGIDLAVAGIDNHTLGDWLHAHQSAIDKASDANRQRAASAKSSLHMTIPTIRGDIHVPDTDKQFVAELGMKLQQSKNALLVLEVDSLLTPRMLDRRDVRPEPLREALSNFCSVDGHSVLVLSGWGRDQLVRFFSQNELTGKNLMFSSHRGAEIFNFKNGIPLTTYDGDAASHVQTIAELFERIPEWRRLIDKDAKLLQGRVSLGFYLGNTAPGTEDQVREIMQNILSGEAAHAAAFRIFETQDYIGLVPKPSQKLVTGGDVPITMDNPVVGNSTALKFIQDQFGFSDIVHFATQGDPRRRLRAVQYTREVLGGETVHIGQRAIQSNAEHQLTGYESFLAVLSLAGGNREGLK
ncbi:MAG: trehalose-6-phosphate synthase [Bdellovibrionales bacterium]|nr:trehalose-6-phosphate synthase [Bdellovibrionales bacterium]